MKNLIVLKVVCAVLLFAVSNAAAGEIDLLVEKLVEKKILTAGEAQQILTETKEEIRKEIAAGKSDSLPAWVQNFKLKGDFRLRYQMDHTKKQSSTATTDDQHRARIRARLGVEGKASEKLKVGLGFATGKADDETIDKDTARSTNQTLGNGFSKHTLQLDYAYAEYAALPWMTLIGGKFKNPFWEPGDLIWDSDINPEGGAAIFTKRLNQKTELFFNAAGLVLEESSDHENDPTLAVGQLGGNFVMNNKVSIRGAVSYYDTIAAVGKALDGTTSTNSTSNSLLKYDYNWFAPAVEIKILEPLSSIGLNLPYMALFGEYVNNIASGVRDRNTGYMLGVKFGAEKVQQRGDWQLKYNFSKYGKDAFLDILPDSDRYGGNTGVKAHEAALEIGLGANTWLGVDYYYAEQLKGNFASKHTTPKSLIQVDWNIKF